MVRAMAAAVMLIALGGCGADSGCFGGDACPKAGAYVCVRDDFVLRACNTLLQQCLTFESWLVTMPVSCKSQSDCDGVAGGRAVACAAPGYCVCK